MRVARALVCRELGRVDAVRGQVGLVDRDAFR